MISASLKMPGKIKYSTYCTSHRLVDVPPSIQTVVHNAVVDPHNQINNFSSCVGFPNMEASRHRHGRATAELAVYREFKTLDLNALPFTRIPECRPVEREVSYSKWDVRTKRIPARPSWLGITEVMRDAKLILVSVYNRKILFIINLTYLLNRFNCYVLPA